MKKKALRKGLKVFVSAMLAGLIVTPGLFTLAHDLQDEFEVVYATEGNKVFIKEASYEASDSNIVYVNVRFEGEIGDKITVMYRTVAGTAIENIDYQGVSNSITVEIGVTHFTEYQIGIKCLNDASSREIFRVSEGDKNYGRYFTVELTGAKNADVDPEKNSCKCYLPYTHKVTATTGIYDTTLYREVAYLDDYKDMVYQYASGTGIDGGSTWRSWQHGISFDNDTTRKWVNTYINSNMAKAYGTFLVNDIDDNVSLFSDGQVSVLMGNKEFKEKYKRDKSCPGCYLYIKVDPPGTTLERRSMSYISQWINPYKKDDDLIDCENYVVGDDHKNIYWFVDRDTWFSSKDSVYDSTFYRIDPVNGVLDQAITAYNHNSEYDMLFKGIWGMMTLYDDSCPVITKQYCDYNTDNGALRIYLRFNEPVYAHHRNSLTVIINNYSTKFDADYVEGNYSDTLVYEIPASELPKRKIDSVVYQLPSDDIGDMAYKLDCYKLVQHNMVQNTDMNRTADIVGGSIDLVRPSLNVDIKESNQPNNIYNIVLSANNNGETTFSNGTVYYTFDTNDFIVEPTSPLSYTNTHVLTSEEQGSFPITLVKNVQAGITSGKYYLHALAVSNYGFTSTNTFGPYNLDGDAPEITQQEPEVSELTRKTYVFDIADKATGTDIKDITAVVKYHSELENKEAKLTILKDGAIPTELNKIITKSHDDVNNKTVYKYKSKIVDDGTGIPLDSFIQDLMGENKRLEIDLHFEVSDDAGNKSISNAIKTVYDVRATFDMTVTEGEGYVEDTSINIGTNVYDISGGAAGSGMTFVIPDDSEDPNGMRALIDKGAKFSLIVNDKDEYKPSGVPDNYTIVLKDFKPGYYEVLGRITGTVEETEINMISKVATYYLTNDKTDETINKETASGNLVLTNRVYQLENVKYYYFNPDGSTVLSHLYGATYESSVTKYVGGSPNPTFSSNIEAKKYVKYMEYQDLELISISDNIASYLNSGIGSTVYVKANKETMFAKGGQLWIRYKKNTWNETTGSNGWAFYYYGEGDVSDGLNINGLSSNLNAAIDEVVNRIVSAGKEKYLVEEENLERISKAPYLSETQMHIEPETVTQTKCGITYLSAPKYNGDANLYQNTVVVGDKTYPLATNMVLSVSDNTSLYYRYTGSATWNHIEVEDGMLLKDALSSHATGIYTIREYDNNGVSEFDIYLDNDFPTLNVTLNKGLPDETQQVLDGSGAAIPITCQSLTIDSLVNEADNLSFVAIYSYPGRVLKTVLYKDAAVGYSLSDINAYLQIGDRSGNVVTYTIRTSTSKIEISMEENEAKTAVIVKVNNRSESEIYSYEVYLNETLIDTEYAASKTYRDAGVYRVEIVDIYGNSETLVLSHESPSPTLTWYYLNDNGGYSVYDPNNPVRLVLEDSTTSARTTDVYASTLVRVVISSSYDSGNVEFEMTGIDPTAYSYNQLNGSLSINSLEAWTLRVWYAKRPETDRTYVFNVDNTAPEISGTFVGTQYHHVVVYDEIGRIVTTASFDAIDFSKYKIGDVVTLDNLDYAIDATETMNFDSGSIISTERAILTVSDVSGIKKVEVTRNGQEVKAELSQDNQIILTGYGEYVVKVTDNLSNVATFKFNNVEATIADAKVDGELIKENKVFYGHDTLEVDMLFTGADAILVRSEDGSSTYLFKYDGTILTYGQYYVVEEQYVDDEGQIQKDLVARYYPNEEFVLYADGEKTSLDKWYIAVEDDNYVIYAMIDNYKKAHFKVDCIEKEIAIESYCAVGKGHIPTLYKATLSKQEASITLLNGDEPVEIIPGMDYIYISNDLTIDANSVSESITKIEYSFAELDIFEKYTTIYDNGEWLIDFVGKEYGFYRIIVDNKYHNQKVYTICKITAFQSKVVAHTLGGFDITYYDNEGTIYSNDKIELIVFSDSVSFEVNGSPATGKFEGGVTTYTISADGKYAVKVIGANGISENFSFEIGTDSSFFFDESWITGYNTEALLYEQGYTNTECSIILDEDVYYIEMIVNDDNENIILLYDNLTPEKKTDPEPLEKAIGRYGIGKYEVIFRNKYGDKTSKIVHFNNVPSLHLTRNTTANPTVYQEYDLDFAIEKGFYSNYVLAFSTDSKTYRFTVRGEEIRLDETKKIEFTNAAGQGSFSYPVTYLDEYGNYVEFEAILYRKEVEYDASAMKTITSNNTIYTKDDIVITFGEDLKATVSIDGKDPVDYNSGEMRFADGEYKFVVRDIAGNTATYIINHKSMNHYSLTSGNNGQEIMVGGVVNDANVVFSSTDGSKIKYVVRNGELLPEYNSQTFSVTGHYEIIIEDVIGNQSYERFYVLKNSLCQFEYVAPFDYEVTEVWRINSDGSREPINYRGPSITLTENGNYVVVVTSKSLPTSFNFSVSIDNTAPVAQLVGVENGGITARDVSLSGLKVGDIVKVYKDDVLVSTTEVKLSSDVPAITKSGKYRLSITNVQGVTLEYTFTRKAVTNVAGSIFVIVSCGLLVVGITIGLIYHTKLKTDD